MTGRPLPDAPGASRGKAHGRDGAVLIALFLMLSMPTGCMNNAFYGPTQMLYDAPENYGLQAEEVFFQSGDGVRLQGWIYPAAGASLGVVVYFHGYYGNLTHYIEQFHWLPDSGFTVFAFNYRGYGQSQGELSRRGVHQDALAALAYARSHPVLGAQDRFVFGQSLGGAVAVPAVADTDDSGIRAVILEGAFHSYRVEAREMMDHAVREQYGAVPCLGLQTALLSRLAVSDALNPGDRIGELSPIPVLLIHCETDRTVLLHHSRYLYEKASQPKALWVVDDCEHMAVFGPKATDVRYRRKLTGFLTRHLS